MHDQLISTTDQTTNTNVVNGEIAAALHFAPSASSSRKETL